LGVQLILLPGGEEKVSDTYVIEIDSERYYLCFRWVSYIPGTMTQTPGAEPSPTAR